MEKPDSLRAALTAAYPQLARDPERLNMWVERGKIRAPMTPDLGLAWEYTLSILITDCTTQPSVLFFAINQWCRTNQPDLLSANPSHGYEFEADIIDPNTVDLHITLKLTEQVTAMANTDGSFTLQHIAEPDMTWLIGTPLTDPPVTLSQIIPAPGTTPLAFPFPESGLDPDAES
jgi:hypothetical protein